MPYGARGHIGILKETEWGTWATGANDFHLPFVSETLTTNIEELLSAAQRGTLDEPKSYQGERSFGGDIVLEVHPASIGHILRSAINTQYPASPDPAGTAMAVLENCNDAWNEKVDGGVYSTIDNVDKKEGTNSVKLIVTTGVAVNGGVILATEKVSEAPGINMTSDTHVKLWIKSSIICEGAGDLILILSEVAECGGEEGVTMKSINIGTLSAGVWTEKTLDVDNDYLDAVISIGIKMVTDLGECIIHIDDIRRLVTTNATDSKQHIFKPRQADDFSADCPINPYTLEVYRDQGNPFQFLGAIVNTLALDFSTTDKILKATCGIIAKDIGDTPKLTKALETTKPFVWENATITISAASTVPAVGAMNDIESFGINFDNRCVGKYALNKSEVIRKIVRDGFRTIPVSFTVDFVNRTEYDEFIAGNERSFTIKFVGALCETKNSNKYYYTLQIDMPSVRYLTYPINIGGPGRIVCGVTGKAKYDATAGILCPIKFTLINTETGYN